MRKLLLRASGAIVPFLASGGVALAQSTTTPGVPNTGTGDVTTNVALLAGSAVVALVAGYFLLKERSTSNV